MFNNRIKRVVPLIFALMIFVIGCSNGEEASETTSESDDTTMSVQEFNESVHFSNSAMSEAYTDYQMLLNNFKIGNFDGQNFTPDETGANQTEVINNFDAQVEPEYIKSSEEESYLQYYYESDQPLYGDVENSPTVSATISLYFIGDYLTQASVSTNQSSFEQEEILTADEVSNSLGEGENLETLSATSPTIIGLSRMTFNDQTYDQYAIPTLSTSDNQMVHLPILSDGSIASVNTLSQSNADMTGLSNVMLNEFISYNAVEILGLQPSETAQETSLPTLHNYDELSANFDTLVEQTKAGEVTSEQAIDLLGEPSNQSDVSLLYQSQADNRDMYNVALNIQDGMVVLLNESWTRQDEETLHNFTMADIDQVSQMSIETSIDEFVSLYGEPTSRSYIPTNQQTIYTWNSPSEDAEVQVFQLTINSEGTIEEIAYN